MHISLLAISLPSVSAGVDAERRGISPSCFSPELIRLERSELEPPRPLEMPEIRLGDRNNVEFPLRAYIQVELGRTGRDKVIGRGVRVEPHN